MSTLPLTHKAKSPILRLQKRDFLSTNDASFEVLQGELFGFLGPNGAGKTNTINMLTGLARPDAGKIRIAGIDCTGNPKAAQYLTGLVPDESNLYPELTGFDNLCFCAALYRMKKKEREDRARELLETFGLADAAHRKFAGYSRGMKRKLTIAAGIIHNPPILFLGEPTTGIDAASARQIRQLIAGLYRAGTTIFLTTHYIEEAERLCGRIAFIPMIFLCGLFFPIERLPAFLRPLSYLLPPTYGADILHGAFGIGNTMPVLNDFALLIIFNIGLFLISLRNIQRRWII